MNATSIHTDNHRSLEELFGEFCQVADQLGMPHSERIGIAGLTEADWGDCADGSFDVDPPAQARCVRRLSYSLPLLRRILQNQNGRAPDGRGRMRPASGHVRPHYHAT